MKRVWIYLLLLLFAFLQTTFAPINLVLLLVVLWAAIRTPKDAIIFSFIAGIVLDLLSGRLLGMSALLFLTTIVLFSFFRKNVWSSHILAVSAVVFVSSFLFSLATSAPWNIWRAVAEVLLMIILKPVISFVDVELQGEQPIQLDFRDRL
ncbi:MAG TPA: rod shape-determining protein MreD [Patescibacteria group bacterium]|nr:rod shape-determining protein MreD [Patescibacteria group bacterium]